MKTDITLANTNIAQSSGHIGNEDIILRNYIREINKAPLLTHDQEMEYAEQSHLGNIDAANILISSHLRLVVKLSYGYRGYGLPMMDLISEGNLGLINSVKQFNQSLGYRFSTYASWHIRAAIQNFILKSWSIVKVATTKMQRRLFFSLRSIKNKIRSLTHSQNDVDIKAIMHYTGASEADISRIENSLSKRDNSFDDVTSDAHPIAETMTSSIQSPEQIILQKSNNQITTNALQSALSILSDRELTIIKSRFLSDNGAITLQELSKIFNVSKERIRQISERALQKLALEMHKLLAI